MHQFYWQLPILISEVKLSEKVKALHMNPLLCFCYILYIINTAFSSDFLGTYTTRPAQVGGGGGGTSLGGTHTGVVSGTYVSVQSTALK